MTMPVLSAGGVFHSNFNLPQGLDKGHLHTQYLISQHFFNLHSGHINAASLVWASLQLHKLK